jgi:5-(carboxyamino)imidazole ribonucleotide mutase
MRHAVDTLERLGVDCDVRVLSAHRTPDALLAWAAGAEEAGLRVVIAGAGGAAHLPGVVAAKTLLPVLGVPMESASLKGLDSLLSIVQMPGGVPVGTLGIGKPGAINAGLLAARILGRSDPAIASAVAAFVEAQAAKILATGDPREAPSS